MPAPSSGWVDGPLAALVGAPADDRVAARKQPRSRHRLTVAGIADRRVDRYLTEREAVVLRRRLAAHPRRVQPVRAGLKVIRRGLGLNGDRREPLDAARADVPGDDDPQWEPVHRRERLAGSLLRGQDVLAQGAPP